MVIIEPCNSRETKLAVEYCVNVATENCALRLVIGPSPRKIELPEDYEFSEGKGIPLTQGDDALLFAYGPVMLHEALVASELLKGKNFGLKVVNMPWLNRINEKWLTDIVYPYKKIFVLDDHSVVGGLGDFMLNTLNYNDLLQERSFFKIGLEDFPKCGTPWEVLNYHRLDGTSLAQIISEGYLETLEISRTTEEIYTSEAPQ
jgi:transketolase